MLTENDELALPKTNSEQQSTNRLKPSRYCDWDGGSKVDVDVATQSPRDRHQHISLATPEPVDVISRLLRPGDEVVTSTAAPTDS
jgi:hypothetical protein